MNQIFGERAALSFYLKFLSIRWTRLNLLYPFITSPGPHPLLYIRKTSSTTLNRMVITALAPTSSLSTNAWVCTHRVRREGQTRILINYLWLSRVHFPVLFRDSHLPWSGMYLVGTYKLLRLILTHKHNTLFLMSMVCPHVPTIHWRCCSVIIETHKFLCIRSHQTSPVPHRHELPHCESEHKSARNSLKEVLRLATALTPETPADNFEKSGSKKFHISVLCMTAKNMDITCTHYNLNCTESLDLWICIFNKLKIYGRLSAPPPTSPF